MTDPAARFVADWGSPGPTTANGAMAADLARLLDAARAEGRAEAVRDMARVLAGFDLHEWADRVRALAGRPAGGEGEAR